MSKVGLDTNILLRLANPDDERHSEVLGLLTQVRLANMQAVICTQAIAEFWVVATRPTSANGLGAAVEEVDAEVSRLLSLFARVPETSNDFSIWRKLVAQARITGVRAHDARMAAAYSAAGCDHLLTLNVRDFAGMLELVGLEFFTAKS